MSRASDLTRYLVWNPDAADHTAADDIYAITPTRAAEKWADQQDADNYAIVNGDVVVVHVLHPHGDLIKVAVTGEWLRKYRSKIMEFVPTPTNELLPK
jgi:hypothetical protein